ncbi:unnamed protein product [Closterium sp. Yama58-4]|nr:unnamed protein product [Closterium sp. Yama58-4]
MHHTCSALLLAHPRLRNLHTFSALTVHALRVPFTYHQPPLLSHYPLYAELAYPRVSIIFPSGGVLTDLTTPSTGALFSAQPLPLFSFAVLRDGCGRELYFRANFSFTMLYASGKTGGDGLAFVISSTAAAGTLGGMGYAGMGRSSLAVEFDTWQNKEGKDVSDNHVGVNTHGSPVSKVAVKSKLVLNSGTPYFVWVEYSPAGNGTLNVSLSKTPSPKPAKPLLSTPLSLCDVLEPTEDSSSFYFGFVASSRDKFTQQHTVGITTVETGKPAEARAAVTFFQFLLSLELAELGITFPPPCVTPSPHFMCPPVSHHVFHPCCMQAMLQPPHFHIAEPVYALHEHGVRVSERESKVTPIHVVRLPLPTATGLLVSEATLRPATTSPFTRYVSAGYSPAQDGQAAWTTRSYSLWSNTGQLWQAADQGFCVVASVEAAYGIASNSSSGSYPSLSVNSLYSLMGLPRCSEGSPSLAFKRLTEVAATSGGLEEAPPSKAPVRALALDPATTLARPVAGWKRAPSHHPPSLPSEHRLRFAPRHDSSGMAPSMAAGTRSMGMAAGTRSMGMAIHYALATLGHCSLYREHNHVLTPPPTFLRVQGKKYVVNGFERTAFKGYFGLLLAVQRQPVVVHIEASADSFIQYNGVRTPSSAMGYDGLQKYQDPGCYTGNLNHVVLVTGYLMLGTDDSRPHIFAPFWLIRNSWGSQWGDNGYMRMGIEAGRGWRVWHQRAAWHLPQRQV